MYLMTFEEKIYFLQFRTSLLLSIVHLTSSPLYGSEYNGYSNISTSVIKIIETHLSRFIYVYITFDFRSDFTVLVKSFTHNVLCSRSLWFQFEYRVIPWINFKTSFQSNNRRKTYFLGFYSIRFSCGHFSLCFQTWWLYEK